MEYIGLKMINKRLGLPLKIELPEGYQMRLFQKGDELHWARIAYEAEVFDSIEAGVEYFNSHFATQESRLFERCFFCCDINGLPIGSSMAWFEEVDGVERGRLHWVIVSKSHQGKGLCRPIVIAAMGKLSEEYRSASLTTQTISFKGIRIYLDMGFIPVEESPISEKGWKLVWEVTHHPKLIKYSI